MTSRNLFFKLMREDLKHKLWAFGLAFLSFFFWMPVAAAMRIGDLLQQYERWIANGTTFGIGVTAEMRFQERLMSITLDTVGMSNILNGLTIGTAAIVMALTGFMYVHSRKQMDFYHSVPVRRELIFAAKFINGIIAVFSMYVLNLLFAIGVLAVNGVELSVLYGPCGRIFDALWPDDHCRDADRKLLRFHSWRHRTVRIPSGGNCIDRDNAEPVL